MPSGRRTNGGSAASRSIPARRRAPTCTATSSPSSTPSTPPTRRPASGRRAPRSPTTRSGTGRSSRSASSTARSSRAEASRLGSAGGGGAISRPRVIHEITFPPTEPRETEDVARSVVDRGSPRHRDARGGPGALGDDALRSLAAGIGRRQGRRPAHGHDPRRLQRLVGQGDRPLAAQARRDHDRSRRRVGKLQTQAQGGPAQALGRGSQREDHPQEGGAGDAATGQRAAPGGSGFGAAGDRTVAARGGPGGGVTGPITT